MLKKVNLLLLFTLFISNLHSAEKVLPLTGKIIQNYKTVEKGALKLHIYFPKNHDNTKKVPAVLGFFGGGWVGGTPKQFIPHARFFAQKGLVGISAEYRTKKSHKTSPFECVKDGKSAIRYVREHAKELGVDPNRIIATGGSAGGHVAACTGVIDGFDEPTENLNISSKPNAMILFNPVIDTTSSGYGAEKVKGRETEISPVHHVKSGIVPTIIFHGTADKTVPFENVERFTKLMNKAGNICELVAYPGAVHGFFNAREFRKSSNNKDFEKTTEESYQFLKKNKLVK